MLKYLSLFALIPLGVLNANATTYNCAPFSIPNGQASPHGINNAGIVTGSYVAAGGQHGFRQDAAGNFATLDFPGTAGSQLFAINNNGLAVGAAILSGSDAFFTVDLNNNFTTLTAPAPYTLRAAYGINDNGAISVTVSRPSVGTNAAILNPDGTLTLLPGGDETGSINSSSQVLETGSGQTALVDAGGNLTYIQYPNYFFPPTFDWGLNNAGMLAGYFASGSPSTFLGFTRDPSGTYSELICPNTAIGGTTPQAINDNGLILGHDFIATPLPGEPQATVSTDTIAFQVTPIGVTTQPQTFTIANTSNQRLDVNPPRVVTHSGNENFQISGCNAPGGKSFSLAPGGSCTASVAVTPSDVGGGNGSIAIDDSAPGAPQYITMTVAGNNAPPSCQLSGISGPPPDTATFTAQDAFSGLQSIVLLNSSNATINIPNNYFGSRNPFNFTATQVNPALVSQADFQVTNGVGVSMNCGTTFGGGAGSSWTGLGGPFKGKVAIATNADGRLEAFTHGVDDALWHIFQNAPGGSWSSWESLGGVIASDPSVGVNADGRVEVFAIGTDRALWHIAETAAGADNWSAWTTLGGSATSDIAIAINTDGRLEIFAQGPDSALWHDWQVAAGGSWSGWSSLGGYIGNDPAVAVNADGRLQAFVHGGDTSLWTIAQSSAGNQTWGNWTDLGGSLVGSPTVIANADGRLEAFVQGGDTSLWHNAQSATGGSDWSGWTDLGGSMIGDPAVAVNADGRLEAFVRGGDNALWHIAQASAGGIWGTWTSLDGGLADGVTPARNKDGRIDVFVRAPDNTLLHIAQSSAGNWN